MSTPPSFDLDGLKAGLQESLRAYVGENSQASVSEGFADKAELNFLAHGEANAIFRLNDRRLVRVAVSTPNQRFGGQASRLTGFEKAVLAYIKGTGIGHELVAAKLNADSLFPYTYLVTDYLLGEPLDYSRAHLRRCAHTLAHLHRLPLAADYDVAQLVPPLVSVDQPLQLFYQESEDYALPYLESAGADVRIVEMIMALLAKARSHLPEAQRLIDYPHRCLVHSDHTYDNWVIDEHRAYLIDWEWAEVGSPAGDLGHFLSPVTICRRAGYQMPVEDRAFFLRCYYEALGDRDLEVAVKHHFAAFGPFPAVRSLCWTAGYWITANRWYAEGKREDPSDRYEQFQSLWHAVMAWLDEDI